jgi:hypothetical protein
MLQGWIINIVVAFILRQWVKFGASVDFAKIKADMVTRLTDILPSWLDAEGTAIVNALVDGAAACLGDTAAVEAMLRFAAAEKWPEAIAALKGMLLRAWVPGDAIGQKAQGMLAAA